MHYQEGTHQDAEFTRQGD